MLYAWRVFTLRMRWLPVEPPDPSRGVQDAALVVALRASHVAEASARHSSDLLISVPAVHVTRRRRSSNTPSTDFDECRSRRRRCRTAQSSSTPPTKATATMTNVRRRFGLMPAHFILADVPSVRRTLRPDPIVDDIRVDVKLRFGTRLRDAGPVVPSKRGPYSASLSNCLANNRSKPRSTPSRRLRSWG